MRSRYSHKKFLPLMELEGLLGYLHELSIHMHVEIRIRIRICRTYPHIHTYVMLWCLIKRVKEFAFSLFQSAFSFKGWDHLEGIGHNGRKNCNLP